MKPTKAVPFVLALVAGFSVGWLVAGRHIERHRAALFSRSRLSRTAALSYLAGQVRVETVRLLEDYAGWEPSALLRQRARGIVRRMKTELEAVPG